MSTEEQHVTTTPTARKGIRSLFRRKKRSDKVDGETQPAAETTVIEEEPQDDMTDPEQVKDTTPKMEQAIEEPALDAPRRKGGLRGFFKRGDKRGKTKQDVEAKQDVDAAREDEPTVEDEREPASGADDRQDERVGDDEKDVDARPVASPAPSARDSAFGGEPKYDWIDIETAAAIKIQSSYRRNKVMGDLEKEGLSTAAIRNRSRTLEARKKKDSVLAASSDVPNIFTCCGVGLAFGDATETDYDAVRDLEKKQYHIKKLQQEEHEEKLRSEYGKMRIAKKALDDTEEVYEVVE